MTSLESPARATPAIVAATAPGKREQGATRAMFFAAGFATAAWAALEIGRASCRERVF